MREFKRLLIWQKGLRIACNCYEIVANFPAQERYGLSDQIRRAAVSIPSNIAEGSGRGSDSSYSYFVNVALGSCFELETQLLLAQKIHYGPPALISSTLEEIDEEQKMLISFLKKIRKEHLP